MRKDKGNQGFTLVEMLVSIAIFAIIMTTVAGVLSTMSKMFASAQKDIELQDSVQTTFSLLSDLVKESQVVSVKGHEQSVKLVDGDLYIYKEEIDQNASTYTTKVASSEATLYVAHLDSDSGKLYLYQTKYNPNAQASGGTFADVAVTDSDICKAENLLSKNVKSFAVNDQAENGYIVLDIALEYGSRKAQIAQNVYLRNSNTTIWASDIIEDDETAATPTPTPTTAAEVKAQIAILGGNSYVAESEAISTNANIGVYYDSTAAGRVNSYEVIEDAEVEVSKEVTVNDYVYKCPNCGQALTINTWGISYHNWQCPGIPNHDAATVEENAEWYLANGYIVQDWTGSHTETKIVKEKVAQSNSLQLNASEGKIIIRNESLTADMSNVEVVVYIQDDDAYFTPLDDGTAYLKVDTSLTTGSLAATYYTSAREIGKACKYIKITIPRIAKAETYTVNGEDKVRYDQYVFSFESGDKSGNQPVICCYTVNAN